MSVDRGLNMLHKHGSKSHGAVYKGRGAFLKSVSYQNYVHTLCIFVTRYFFQNLFKKENDQATTNAFFYNFFLFNLFEFLFSFRIKSGWEHRCSWRSNHDVISPRHDPLQARETLCDIIALKRRTMSHGRDVSTSLRHCVFKGEFDPPIDDKRSTRAHARVLACECPRRDRSGPLRAHDD